MNRRYQLKFEVYASNPTGAAIEFEETLSGESLIAIVGQIPLMVLRAAEHEKLSDKIEEIDDDIPF